MSPIRPNFGVRRLRVSRVVYRCDVSSSEAPIIPLGIIADIRVGNVYGLGLIARREISVDEAALIGSFVRPMVRRPFEMLKPIFESVWSHSDSDAEFERLSNDPVSSIEYGSVVTPIITVPRSLLMHAAETAALREWSRDALRSSLQESFWSMIDDHWVDHPDQKDTELKAA